MTETKTKKPTFEIRLGRIKASIWENDTTVGIRHNVTLRRLYTVDDEGRTTWRSSESLGRDDLLLAAKVLDQAHSWILEQGVDRE